MAKAIPKKGSHGRIGSRKSIRKIPKGVIHIQASFNNTIVTVTDVRGRVVSWSKIVRGENKSFFQYSHSLLVNNRSDFIYMLIPEFLIGNTIFK